MLDLHYVREHTDAVAEALRKRRADVSLEPFHDLDQRRRDLLHEVEQLKQERNASSKEIGAIVKSGGDASAMKARVREVGDKITALSADLQTTEAALHEFMQGIPNIPHESVPEGKDEADNREEHRFGDPREFDFEPKAHDELGVALGILDFERAAKITGARFALYVGDGARLERALIQFMLDIHTREHGYTEVLPPFMVNAKALFGTGQLPKFESDLFKVDPMGYYLVPTAEVPVTNIHADEILPADALPLAYCAYTPCFRSEAGSYGKDVRGLIRQHQFNKVELVRFAHPDESYDQLETLTRHAETILERLQLPYRRVTLCSGDISAISAKTYDLEVWVPAQKTYREISSCSNFEDYQARRAKIRMREEEGAKPRLLHTLNGSGLAIGRTLLAILENYQRVDGTIEIPGALRPYLGGQELIEPRHDPLER